VIGGFEVDEDTNIIDTGNSEKFQKVFEEVNKVFAKQTHDRLNVADKGFISAQALVSSSSVTIPNIALLIISIFFCSR
jgi:capsular polysaccharide biosynthesis protein